MPSTLLKFRLLSFAFVLSFASLAMAERLPLKAYTVADGLANNAINKIVRDSRGFLWFCTGEGLSRFDGYSFTNFGPQQGLPHANITDLLETRSGEYWVATNGGLVFFNPKGAPLDRARQDVPPMFTAVVSDEPAGLTAAITVLLEDHNGVIWCGTQQGLYQLVRSTSGDYLHSFEVGIPREYALQQIVSDLLEDRNGSLWVGTPKGLYRHWPDGRTARYTQGDGLPSDYVSDLYEDHEGRLWVATLLGGFFDLISDTSSKPPQVGERYSIDNGLTSNWVFYLSETADNRFWIGTNSGLVQFFPAGDSAGRRFHSYNARNGLTYHEISALGEDIGGNLWLGTNTVGAMKLVRNGFVTYDKQDALITVNAIFEDRSGNVCFKGVVMGDQRVSVFEGAKLELLQTNPPGQYQRFGCFDGERFTWFKPNAVYDFGWVMERVTLQTTNKEWWLSAGEGLFRFPPSNDFAAIKTAKPLAIYSMKDGIEPQVFRLFEDRDDNIWISTLSSKKYQLLRWDRSSETLSDLSPTTGLSTADGNLPRSFGQDQAGNVWIGFNQGVARYAQGEMRFFTASDGLPPGAVMDIFEDRSARLWFASSRSGLLRVEHATDQKPAFVRYTTAEGLASNNAEVIVDDLQGYIYIGGGQGLDRLDPKTGAVKHFTTEDGLAPGLFRAAFRDQHGVLWFGMTGGLSQFVPEPESSRIPTTVLISGLHVAGSPWLISALGETEVDLPELGPNDNQLQIDFLSIGFVAGEVLRYQYKLEGADTEWSAPGELRTINYANLAAGRYKFLVRAMNSDGSTSPIPAIVSFRVLRPLWQRWWFLTLLALSLASLSFAAYRYRVSRLLQMANMRTRIATDLHDDIGANLTRISLLSEVVKQRFGEANESEDGPLMAISRIARESVGSMSDIVWAINPGRDTLLDLTRKMRRHADEVFTLRDIELKFNAPTANESLRLSVDLRRDLLLIFKEAVNNAARHSRCTQVIIEFELMPSKLVLTIADNGIGFDQSIESEGHGLRSLKRRAAVLDGTLVINSDQKAGTIISISVPLGRARKVLS